MRSKVSFLAAALVAAGVLFTGARPLPAAEPALAGNWKVIVLNRGQEITVWLLKVEMKDGKGKASLLSVGLPNFKGTKVDKTQVSPNALRVDLNANGITFEVAGYFPKGEKEPKILYGTVKIRGQSEYIRLERTDAKELEAKEDKSVKESPALKSFGQARKKEGDDRTKALKEIQEKYPTDPLAIEAGRLILGDLVKKGAKEAEVRSAVDSILKTASLYGPEMAKQKTAQVIGLLLTAKKYPNLALTYARQAEKALPSSAPASQRAVALKNLALALNQAGKKDEAGKVQQQVAKLEEELDKEFEKTAIPFKPQPFPGRKEKSDRVVLVELFTGAQCPPCVAADVAFDAALKTYKPSEVVLLQYHLHIPGPDALTNKDTEARQEYYDKAIRGTPTALIDGKVGPALGGYKVHSKGSYEKLIDAVNEELEKKSAAQLKLTAHRQGDKIELAAEIAGLDKPGENMRLRFVLVEEVARYPGGNGQRLHHHVVRAFPGGIKGFALAKKEDKQSVTVDLKELTKTLNDYLTGEKFDEADRPLALKHFKAVAFIQDDKTKEVLQAAQVDVPAEVR